MHLFVSRKPAKVPKRMTLRDTAHKIVPAGLQERLWLIRYYGWPRYRRLQHLKRHAAARHRARNTGLPPDELAVEPGRAFKIHPDARQPFERFTYIDELMVEEMDSFLRFSAPCRCLLDIGALYGAFALTFASRPGCSAWAVDPSPEAFAVLDHHRRVNPNLRLTTVNCAMGGRDGTLLMKHEWIHLVASPAARPAAQDEVEVRVCTLDAFVAEQRCEPDCIKIDTEGYELEVLRGGRKYLSERRPVLFMEVHPSWLERLGQSLEQLVGMLKELGYLIHDVDGRRLKDPVAFLSRTGGDPVHRVICSAHPLL